MNHVFQSLDEYKICLQLNKWWFCRNSLFFALFALMLIYFVFFRVSIHFFHSFLKLIFISQCLEQLCRYLKQCCMLYLKVKTDFSFQECQRFSNKDEIWDDNAVIKMYDQCIQRTYVSCLFFVVRIMNWNNSNFVFSKNVNSHNLIFLQSFLSY